MSADSRPSSFWINWLLAVAAGIVVFGVLLVLAPSLARQGFSLLVYSSPDRIDAFGQEPVRYISLAHAVIGGVMVGWGAALFYVTKTLLAHGSGIAWNLLALSVGAWFVPDTAYSLLSGYWQNALLNTVFLVLFAIPLWATRGNFAVNCLREQAVKSPRVISDPEALDGTPVFVGTRVPVRIFFQHLEAGDPLEVFLVDFPSVSRELAVQVLEDARASLVAEAHPA